MRSQYEIRAYDFRLNRKIKSSFTTHRRRKMAHKYNAIEKDHTVTVEKRTNDIIYHICRNVRPEVVHGGEIAPWTSTFKPEFKTDAMRRPNIEGVVTGISKVRETV